MTTPPIGEHRQLLGSTRRHRVGSGFRDLGRRLLHILPRGHAFAIQSLRPLVRLLRRGQRTLGRLRGGGDRRPVELHERLASAHARALAHVNLRHSRRGRGAERREVPGASRDGADRADGFSEWPNVGHRRPHGDDGFGLRLRVVASATAARHEQKRGERRRHELDGSTS